MTCVHGGGRWVKTDLESSSFLGTNDDPTGWAWAKAPVGLRCTLPAVWVDRPVGGFSLGVGVLNGAAQRCG